MPRPSASRSATSASRSRSPTGNEIIQVLERDPAHPLSPDQLEGKASQAYQAWYTGARGGDNVKNDLSPDERGWILRQVGRGPRPDQP